MQKILKHVDLLGKVIWTGVQLSSPPLFATFAINKYMAYQPLSYLKSRFETGDFPDQNDFHDLLDSCFNFSLSDAPDYISFLNTASGNWEQTYLLVDAKRYQWDEGYQGAMFFSSVSSQFAKNDYLTTNFLNVTGGDIAGNLRVLGSITSGSSSLFDVFLTPANYQNLSFDTNTSNLSIINGNTVTLSSFRNVTSVVFSHNPINLNPNTYYIFGQIPSAVSNTLNGSVGYKSLFNGRITEVNLQNDYGAGGSFESHTIALVNRTQNLSSVVATNLKFSDSLVLVNTQLTNPLDSIPLGWSASSVDDVSDGLRLNGAGSFITTTSGVDSTNFTSLSVFLQGRSSQVGETILTINTLNNTNNIVANPVNLIFDNSFKVGAAIITLNAPTDIIKLNFTADGQTIIKDLNVYGRFPTDTRLQQIALSPTLAVAKGDIIDVRLITPSSYALPAPNNVSNYVTAKLDIIN